ncbi:hypothetical protein GPECTOR_4g969 [Gonium pectorale]|uniref:Uncharacterized protein n=1 Tax=Gonium pectorale TaxID=33097 RepID=A0A150GYB9_GONPE|nr:hypothetical protein GPECTOR_4g969 [Gonium pectorale]|eukprot:KXZ54897.1 hypothetical protein GPECTOR_4g969 [Gonium pectorale]
MVSFHDWEVSRAGAGAGAGAAAGAGQATQDAAAASGSQPAAADLSTASGPQSLDEWAAKLSAPPTGAALLSARPMVMDLSNGLWYRGEVLDAREDRVDGSWVPKPFTAVTSTLLGLEQVKECLRAAAEAAAAKARAAAGGSRKRLKTGAHPQGRGSGPPQATPPADHETDAEWGQQGKAPGQDGCALPLAGSGGSQGAGAPAASAAAAAGWAAEARAAGAADPSAADGGGASGHDAPGGPAASGASGDATADGADGPDAAWTGLAATVVHGLMQRRLQRLSMVAQAVVASHATAAAKVAVAGARHAQRPTAKRRRPAAVKERKPPRPKPPPAASEAAAKRPRRKRRVRFALQETDTEMEELAEREPSESGGGRASPPAAASEGDNEDDLDWNGGRAGDGVGAGEEDTSDDGDLDLADREAMALDVLMAAAKAAAAGDAVVNSALGSILL